MENSSFEEKRSKLKEVLGTIKNRKLIERLFDKNTTIDEQLSQLTNIKNIEDRIENTNNDKIKSFLYSKVNTINKNDIFAYIDNVKNTYNEFERHKSKVAQGLVVMDYIKTGKPLTKSMQENIKDILETTPKDVAMELGLDLSLLKTSMSVYLKSKRDEITGDTSKIVNEEKSIERDIENNVKTLVADISLLEKKKIELSDIISATEDESIKKSKFAELSNIENNLNGKKIDLEEKKSVIKDRISKVKKAGIENYEQINELKKIESFLIETKNIEFSRSLDKVEGLQEIRNLFVENYEKEKPKLIAIYNEQIETENNIFSDSIKSKINDSDVDVENIKKKIEDAATIKNQDDIRLKGEIEESFKEINENIKHDAGITENDDIITKMQKTIEAKGSVLKAGNEKLNLVVEKTGELDKSSIKGINEKDLQKNIGLAVGNIQKKVSDLNKEYQDYQKSGDYDEAKVKDYKYRIDAYKDLSKKLQDKTISSTDKVGLLGLLGKGKWLGEYIQHRSDNYGYNIEYIGKELEKLKKGNTNGKEGAFFELYKKGLEEQKFSLIEGFAKLKSDIPNFENVSLNDDLYKQAQILGISDDETLIKIEKLKNLQDNIKGLDLSLYTRNFLDNGLEYVRLSKENEINDLINSKTEELRKIDRYPGTNIEKDALKSEYLDFFEKKLAQLENEKGQITSEIQQISEFGQNNGFFSKSELSDIANNINLFGVVGKVDQYSDIIAGLSDDIISGNTDFINFENYKHIKSDFYTTAKLNEIIGLQLEIVRGNIDAIGGNPELRQLKNSLIQEKLELEGIERKLLNGEILDNNVLDLISPEVLYKLSLQKENAEILNKLKNPDILPDELENLTKKLKENFDIIKSINEGNISEDLNVKILENTDNYDIDRETINKEISDGFDNANKINDSVFSRYKGYGNQVFENAKARIGTYDELKKKTKIVSEVLFGEDDYINETKEKRKDRHEHLDKYLDAAVSTGFAYVVIFIFKTLQKGSEGFSNIHIYIGKLRDYIESNRVNLFFGTVIMLSMIVLFSTKNSMTFVNLNTHLYSINTYVDDTGNIKFSDIMSGKISDFYYKTNIFLFFLFLIVLYQIIIEFISKYISILKNPTIGIDNLLSSMAKLLLFFLFMGLLFKVNTFIL